MPEQITITKTIYKLDELSDSAKQTAREEWIQGFYDDWSEFVLDDVKRTAELLGIDIDKIYYSGFWSQGDGACFEGNYRYRKDWLKDIFAEYGKDNKSMEEPIRIGKALQALQSKYFYRLVAYVKHSGFYYNENCVSWSIETVNNDRIVSDDTEEELKDILKDYMRYIYRQLEKEYEYQTSMDCFIESCEMNDYRFTENGRLA